MFRGTLYAECKAYLDVVTPHYFVTEMLDKVADAVFEGGLNLHWVESLFYTRSLTGIGRQRKKMAAVSKITLVDDKLLFYPLVILLCGILVGGISCLIECSYHKKRKIKIKEFPSPYYAPGNDGSFGIWETFSKIFKQHVSKYYPFQSNGFTQTPPASDAITLSPFLIEALRGEMSTVY